MIQTNNYEFNIVEGNDIVNPLVQLNPNFTKLDALLKNIADSGIGSALQVKSGTNHAITKDDDCAVFKFIATADYRTGDTFTLNGDTVTVRCMDGTIPKDRAFVINQSVMFAINGTLLTLIGGTNADINASNVGYDNTLSGLSSNNVQGAIDEVAIDLTEKSDKSDIAEVETGTSASRDYKVGEMVYVGGTLHKVIVPISSGTAFSEGTNVELSNVSASVNEQLEQSETDYHYVSKQYEAVTSFTSNTDFVVPRDGMYVFMTDATTISDARRVNIGRALYLTLGSPIVIGLKKGSTIGILSVPDNPIQMYRVY